MIRDFAMRRLAKWLCFVALGLCAGVFGVSKFLHVTWNHEHIARSVSKWISNPLAGNGGPAPLGAAMSRRAPEAPAGGGLLISAGRATDPAGPCGLASPVG